MHIKIKNEHDFWSGAAFTATGIGFAWGATAYNLGTSSEPGPGYFPIALGILLAFLGLVLIAEALSVGTHDEQKIGTWVWKPVIWITLAVAFFGWALPHFGMFIAIPILVLTSAIAGQEFRWTDALISGAVLAIGSWGIFVLGLKLSIPLWPTFLSN